jgi:hypothetical protein
VLAHLLDDIGRQSCPTVVHRHQNICQLEARVEGLADSPDCALELRDSFQRVVLALNRKKNFIGRDQGVDRE